MTLSPEEAERIARTYGNESLAAIRLSAAEGVIKPQVDRTARAVAKIDAAIDRHAPVAVEPFLARTADETAANPAPVVVQGLLGGLCVLASPPNAGKSAFAVDLLAHVAAGAPFFGRKLLQGPTIYFAAEAPYSILTRTTATSREKFSGRRLPTYIVCDAPRLGSETDSATDAARIIATIREVSSVEGEQVRVIALDTVAATLAGGDENGTGMLMLVQACQTIIQQTGVSVLLLHHPSKADGAGLRGHSCLLGAADVVLTIANDDPAGARVVRISKARDFAVGNEIVFALEPVAQIERDSFGDPTTTVIVRPASVTPKKASFRGRLQQATLIALAEWSRTHDAPIISSIELAGLLRGVGAGRQRKPELVATLTMAGILAPTVGGHIVKRELLS